MQFRLHHSLKCTTYIFIDSTIYAWCNRHPICIFNDPCCNPCLPLLKKIPLAAQSPMCNHAMHVRNQRWLALPHLPVIPLVFLRLPCKKWSKSSFGLARLKYVATSLYSSNDRLRRFHCMMYTLHHPDISTLYIFPSRVHNS